MTMLHALSSQALTLIWMSLILKLFASDIIFANHRQKAGHDVSCAYIAKGGEIRRGGERRANERAGELESRGA